MVERPGLTNNSKLTEREILEMALKVLSSADQPGQLSLGPQMASKKTPQVQERIVVDPLTGVEKKYRSVDANFHPRFLAADKTGSRGIITIR